MKFAHVSGFTPDELKRSFDNWVASQKPSRIVSTALHVRPNADHQRKFVYEMVVIFD